MNKKIKKKHQINSNKFFPIFIFTAALFMGIGYSIVNSIIIDINGSACYGHGFDETSGWYNDSSVFIDIDNPWVMWGGVFDSGQSGGIFSYVGTIGYSGSYATFRMSLVEEN